MNYGFYKVASITPDLKLGNIKHNTTEIIKLIHEANDQEVKICVFPELAITGYSNSDLFLNNSVVKEASHALHEILNLTGDTQCIAIIGLPYRHLNKLYNTMAIIYQGELLALVPKTHLPNYREHFEQRYFARGPQLTVTLFNHQEIPFGSDILFRNTLDDDLILAVEICEDLWVPNSPSINHALAGATIIANGSAGIETVTKANYRRQLVSSHSAKLCSGYIYTSAGLGESSTDAVYSGHNLIAENGVILKESDLFSSGMIISEIDVSALRLKRQQLTSFENELDTHQIIDFEMIPQEVKLTRTIDKNPFIKPHEMAQRSELILNIQAKALSRRLTHIHSRTILIGLSGGLDSTLAVLGSVKCYQDNGWDTKDIITVTMPGLGTTDRTYQNALQLAKELNTTLMEINISDAVKQHFTDIKHDGSHDATFENAQARERTQILMDLANKHHGIVVGTGDLSELALGWATYNGDHMSMYGLNAGIPKTIIRRVIDHYAQINKEQHPELYTVLMDILDTPISPELVPTDSGVITQKTEDLIGPYELHDFFLYYFIAAGFEPRKIRYLAHHALQDDYSTSTIDKWLLIFLKRFFAQQYKRSALPDGPRIGSVSLSPRAGYRMPSDSLATLWIEELESIVNNSVE